jgi:hypothetical protein
VQKLKLQKQEEVLIMVESIKEYMRKLSNLSLNIKNIHIRYEDDYFSTPFSFGLLIDDLKLESNHVNSSFKHSNSHKAAPGKEGGVQCLKQLKITNLSFYWNSMSETFVPTSLWEQTKDLENRIFDAI